MHDNFSISELLGNELVDSNGSRFPSDRLIGKSTVALYFSKNKCKWCKEFFPVLDYVYKEISTREPNLMEVVFVSSDASLDEYQISVSGYDWPSVPYERRDIKEMLISKFGFKTVPQLVILDTSTGKVVDAKARRTFEGLQDDIGMIINTISRAEFSL